MWWRIEHRSKDSFLQARQQAGIDHLYLTKESQMHVRSQHLEIWAIRPIETQIASLLQEMSTMNQCNALTHPFSKSIFLPLTPAHSPGLYASTLSLSPPTTTAPLSPVTSSPAKSVQPQASPNLAESSHNVSQKALRAHLQLKHQLYLASISGLQKIWQEVADTDGGRQKLVPCCAHTSFSMHAPSHKYSSWMSTDNKAPLPENDLLLCCCMRCFMQ